MLARYRVALGGLWPRSTRVAGAADARAACCSAPGSSALGEALRIWAAGHLEKSREVTSSGPYRYTRHPLYLGLVADRPRRRGRGAITCGSGWPSSAYLAATLTAAMRAEEAHLREKFGGAYDAYARAARRRRAPALQPGAGDRATASTTPSAGSLAGLSLLALKVWL